MLERWTLRVLISAIMNGAAQDCRSSSRAALLPFGCFGAGEAGRQRERIVQDRDQADVLGHRIEGRLRARRGAARERAAHVAHAALHARAPARRTHAWPLPARRTRRARTARNRSRRKTRCARRSPSPPPRACRSSAASRSARRRDRNNPCRWRRRPRTVPRRRADTGPTVRDHRHRLLRHRLQRGGVRCIRDNQRRISGRADRVAHRFQLAEATACHRPFERPGRSCNAESRYSATSWPVKPVAP